MNATHETELTHAEAPAAAAEAAAATLRDSVADAMQRYFDNLDGERPADVYKLALAEFEEPFLIALMKYVNENQSLAARVSGLSRGTLRKKLKIYGLL